MRTSRTIVLAMSLVLPLSVLAAAGNETPASGDQPADRPVETAGGDKAEGEAQEPEVLRFTNADLKPVRPQDRYPERNQDQEAEGRGEAGPDREAGESLDEALQGLTEEALQSSVDETRREIVELEMQLEYLNSRLLAVKNPLLKRVTPASREEEEAVGGLPNTERLSWVMDQIAATEESLAEAQNRMSDLLRR